MDFAHSLNTSCPLSYPQFRLPFIVKACSRDSACSADQRCRQSLPMYQQLEGACTIGTKGFADFLGGAGSVLLRMGMAEAVEGGKTLPAFYSIFPLVSEPSSLSCPSPTPHSHHDSYSLPPLPPSLPPPSHATQPPSLLLLPLAPSTCGCTRTPPPACFGPYFPALRRSASSARRRRPPRREGGQEGREEEGGWR